MARLLYNSGGYAYTNSGESAIDAGDVVVNASLFGIAAAPIAVGATGWVETTGVWELPIASATTASVGAAAYWDTSNSQVTTTASTNLPIGKFVAASASGETTCKILLGNVAVAASGSGS